jgi:hypothetical protein
VQIPLDRVAVVVDYPEFGTASAAIVGQVSTYQFCAYSSVSMLRRDEPVP